MNIFGYGRGSTLKQVTTLLKQEEMCVAYYNFAFAMGKTTTPFGGFYVDAATSGSIPMFEREAGFEMLNLMKPGDLVVISEKDRAFRSCLDACNTLDLLLERKLCMHMLDCPFDLSTDTGRCFLQVFASFGELDRKNIGRRTSEAKQYRIKLELPVGGVAYVGWKIKGRREKATYAPDHDRRKMGEYIAMLRDDHSMSFIQITDHMKSQNIRNSNGRHWHRDIVRKTYYCCKAGWPKISSSRLADLKEIAASASRASQPRDLSNPASLACPS